MNCKPYIRAHATNCWKVLPRSCAYRAWKACRKSMRRSVVSLPVRCTKRLRSAKSWASGPAIWTTASAGAKYGEGEKWWLCSVIWTLLPAGDGWTETEPFSGEIKTAAFTDAARWTTKGPMVAAIYALAALKDAGFAPSKRIRLLFGTNEETGCGDMSWYVSHGGELPVYGFTPDGGIPIINGEKGILNGTYSRKLHLDQRLPA